MGGGSMVEDGSLLTIAGFFFSVLAALGVATPLYAKPERSETQQRFMMENEDYTGLWVTADGVIRHELLPNGRYVEARGTRERAYEGQYRIVENHIEYEDDTGFGADGDFKDGILYHAGMVLYRNRVAQ
jgi:hypothetical protein